MQGEFVVVRASGDEPVVCRLVEVEGGLAYVSTPSEYERYVGGADEALSPVGVPIQDLYRYEPELDRMLAAGSFSWSAISRYG